MNALLESRHVPQPLPCPAAPDADLLAGVLDEIDYAVLILETGGTLVHANRRARAILAAGDTLRQGLNASVAPCAAGHDAWKAALRGAAQGRRSLVAIGSGTARLQAAIGPLGGASGEAERVLVTIGRQAACDPLTVMAYAKLHHLTGAEASVLSMLCTGLSPAEVADANGVSKPTVFTQVRSIYAKLGTHSVRRLLVELAGLPPMRPCRAALRTVAPRSRTAH